MVRATTCVATVSDDAAVAVATATTTGIARSQAERNLIRIDRSIPAESVH
jgi:hypothetical protein